MQKKQIYILILICLNIGADQYTKNIARLQIEPEVETIHSRLPGNYKFKSETEIFGKLLQLMNVENPGAFLGVGSEANPTIKMIFLLIVPLLLLTAVLYYLFTNKSIDRLTTIGLSCVVGGGIANLCDRFIYGSVTDFLLMDFNFARTGIFNLADLSITTGMVLILISAFKEKNRKSKPLS